MATGRAWGLLEETIAPAAVTGLLDDITLQLEHGVVDPGRFDLLRAGSAPTVQVPIALHKTGRRERLWDEVFFGIILVIPRTKDLGGIVSNTTFQVEVWNADEVAHRATGVAVTGSDGVSVAPVPTLPAFWPPFSSYFSTVTVLAEGEPVVDDFVTWAFPGFTGTDCHVIGVRLTIFALSPQWDVGFQEAMSWLTNVITARLGKEQRAALRSVPRRTFHFTGLAIDRAEAAEMALRLANGGRSLFTVPYWPDRVALGATAAPGATSIVVSTTNRIFAVGGLVILWRDGRTWEVQQIAGVSSGSLLLVDPLVGNWPAAGTLVIPLLAARLSEDPALTRFNPSTREIAVAFETEPQ